MDKTADKIARSLDFKVIPMPAEWNKYGLAAGPIRNGKMLDLGIDMVFVFHRDIENSKGSRDMINQAKSRGIETYLIS